MQLLLYLVPVGLPFVDSVDFVESYDERNLLLLEHVDGLDGLGFEAVHDVDDEDGDVAERRTPVAEVRERLVARGVDDQKPGKFHFLFFELFGKNKMRHLWTLIDYISVKAAIFYPLTPDPWSVTKLLPLGIEGTQLKVDTCAVGLLENCLVCWAILF